MGSLQLTASGIPQAKGVIRTLDSTTYKELTDELGIPLVIKPPIGASGTGVFFVSSEDHFRSLQSKLAGEDLLITEYIVGPSYNIHGVIWRDSLLISAPSVQLVGLQECSDGNGIYCGNDFSSFALVDQDTYETILQAARRIGQWMAGQGFQGLFGIDFVGQGSNTVPVEINPRFQGSTSLLTQAELARGKSPTTLYHMAAFADLWPNLPTPRSNDEVPDLMFGSQIVLHAKNQKRETIDECIVPGVYQLEVGPRLEYVRPGVSLNDCHSADEFVVTCAVPRTGTLVNPGSSLLKVVAPVPVVDASIAALNVRAGDIVRLIYEQLSFRGEDEGSIHAPASTAKSSRTSFIQPSGGGRQNA